MNNTNYTFSYDGEVLRIFWNENTTFLVKHSNFSLLDMYENPRHLLLISKDDAKIYPCIKDRNEIPPSFSDVFINGGEVMVEFVPQIEMINNKELFNKFKDRMIQAIIRNLKVIEEKECIKE